MERQDGRITPFAEWVYPPLPLWQTHQHHHHHSTINVEPLNELFYFHHNRHYTANNRSMSSSLVAKCKLNQALIMNADFKNLDVL